MKIEIWSDFACPFCYLGKKRFEAALQSFAHKDKVEVTYKAYQLNPHAPKSNPGDAATAFATNHGMTVEQAKERFASITAAGKKDGLTYRYDIMQMTSTFDAHRLAKWAGKFNLEPQLTERLMKAYFSDGLNIADHDTLTFIAKGVGLDGEVAKAILSGHQYANQVLEQQAEARQIGVQGVPFFVLNRQYGVSGAQSSEYFLQVLNKLWDEEHKNPLPESDAKHEYCDDEGCHIE